MDHLNVPHKVQLQIEVYPAEWTEQERTARPPTRTVITEAWFEPGPDGAVEISDPVRIAALEASTTKE